MEDIQRPGQVRGNGNLIMQVREGMHVYDREGNKVGAVEEVYFGSAGEQAPDMGTAPQGVAPADLENPATPLKDVVVGFADDYDLPDALRNRLLYEGFLRVEGSGLFDGDRLVSRDQIAAVSGDRVTLNVARNELVKR